MKIIIVLIYLNNNLIIIKLLKNLNYYKKYMKKLNKNKNRI